MPLFTFQGRRERESKGGQVIGGGTCGAVKNQPAAARGCKHGAKTPQLRRRLTEIISRRLRPDSESPCLEVCKLRSMTSQRKDCHNSLAVEAYSKCDLKRLVVSRCRVCIATGLFNLVYPIMLCELLFISPNFINRTLVSTNNTTIKCKY